MSFDFLIEMAWKSALIGAAALLIAAALGRRSAGERSAVLRTAIAFILALPLISAFLPALPVVTRTIYETVQPTALGSLDIASGAAATTTPGKFDDPTPLIELAWLGGVMMVLLRLGVGLATLSRWTRNGSKVNCPQWREAFERAVANSGCKRPVRLLLSDAPSPMSWGWLHPVILLDRDTVRDVGEADAVLAHELAHVVRGDWLLLILARLVAALFWFNPLMWLLERRLVAEAEEAADSRALEHVEPSHYAQTLLSCAQQYSALTVPAAGMADAGLARRVRAILDQRLRAGAPDPKWIRVAVVLCAIVATPIAALKPVAAIIPAYPPSAPPAPLAPVAPLSPLAAVAAAPLAPSARVGLAGLAAVAPEPPLPPEAAPAPPTPPAPPIPPHASEEAFWSDEDSREVERAVRDAHAEASMAREQALRDGEQARADALRQAAQARAEAQQAVRVARIEARRGLAQGAVGMESGARGMEEGARQMEGQAERFRSTSYRSEQIARAAREGRTITHEEMIAMIPKLRTGAERMRRGAEKMRQDAARMRAGQGD